MGRIWHIFLDLLFISFVVSLLSLTGEPYEIQVYEISKEGRTIVCNSNAKDDDTNVIYRPMIFLAKG